LKKVKPLYYTRKEPKAKKSHSSAVAFFLEHSLSLVTAATLILWIVLYHSADPETHLGAFYGNAIADWTGTLLLVVGTKWLYERGSAESREPPRHLQGPVWEFLYEHSLTIVMLVSGAGWLGLYAQLQPMDKWGQVVGNLLSEWVQVFGIIVLSKGLFERGSKESRA
jgi:hypothetical protein